jgi:hypothetical protein
VQLIAVKPSSALPASAWSVPTAVQTRVIASNEVELSVSAGIGDRLIRRLDVARPTVLAIETDASVILVRDSNGVFVPLQPGGVVTVIKRPPDARSTVEHVLLRAPVEMKGGRVWFPLTFRLTIGDGENRSVWSYTIPVSGARRP